MQNILFQPYPQNLGTKQGLKVSVFISSLVFLMLLLFKPFNLDAFPSPNKLLVISGYGIVSFAGICISLILIPKILPAYFKEEKWKVIHEIAITLWCFFLIGLFNLLYSNWLGFIDLSLKGFISFQAITLAVGFFPVCFFVMLKQNRMLKSNLKEAVQFNKSIEIQKLQEVISPTLSTEIFITISSENGKEKIEIPAQNLLFISAAENYVEVYWMNENKLQKTLFRNTLSKIESSLSAQKYFYRCHRTWLVNLKNIAEVTGNAQGLKLGFAQTEIQVPVSRSQIKQFRELMNSMQL